MAGEPYSACIAKYHKGISNRKRRIATYQVELGSGSLTTVQQVQKRDEIARLQGQIHDMEGKLRHAVMNQREAMSIRNTKAARSAAPSHLQLQGSFTSLPIRYPVLIFLTLSFISLTSAVAQGSIDVGPVHMTNPMPTSGYNNGPIYDPHNSAANFGINSISDMPSFGNSTALGYSTGPGMRIFGTNATAGPGTNLGSGSNTGFVIKTGFGANTGTGPDAMSLGTNPGPSATAGPIGGWGHFIVPDPPHAVPEQSNPVFGASNHLPNPIPRPLFFDGPGNTRDPTAAHRYSTGSPEPKKAAPRHGFLFTRSDFKLPSLSDKTSDSSVLSSQTMREEQTPKPLATRSIPKPQPLPEYDEEEEHRADPSRTWNKGFQRRALQSIPRTPTRVQAVASSSRRSPPIGPRTPVPPEPSLESSPPAHRDFTPSFPRDPNTPDLAMGDDVSDHEMEDYGSDSHMRNDSSRLTPTIPDSQSDNDPISSPSLRPHFGNRQPSPSPPRGQPSGNPFLGSSADQPIEVDDNGGMVIYAAGLESGGDMDQSDPRQDADESEGGSVYDPSGSNSPVSSASSASPNNSPRSIISNGSSDTSNDPPEPSVRRRAAGEAWNPPSKRQAKDEPSEEECEHGHVNAKDCQYASIVDLHEEWYTLFIHYNKVLEGRCFTMLPLLHPSVPLLPLIQILDRLVAKGGSKEWLDMPIGCHEHKRYIGLHKALMLTSRGAYLSWVKRDDSASHICHQFFCKNVIAHLEPEPLPTNIGRTCGKTAKNHLEQGAKLPKHACYCDKHEPPCLLPQSVMDARSILINEFLILHGKSSVDELSPWELGKWMDPGLVEENCRVRVRVPPKDLVVLHRKFPNVSIVEELDFAHAGYFTRHEISALFLGTRNRDKDHRFGVVQLLMRSVMDGKDSSVGGRCWQIYLDNAKTTPNDGFTAQKNYKCVCCFASKYGWTPPKLRQPNNKPTGGLKHVYAIFEHYFTLHPEVPPQYKLKLLAKEIDENGYMRRKMAAEFKSEPSSEVYHRTLGHMERGKWPRILTQLLEYNKCALPAFVTEEDEEILVD